MADRKPEVPEDQAIIEVTHRKPVKKIVSRIYVIAKEVIFIGLVLYFISTVMFFNKKELLNYGYVTGWNFALKAYANELRFVQKEVLDMRYAEWRNLYQKQVQDVYKVNIFENWEKVTYEVNSKVLTNI